MAEQVAAPDVADNAWAAATCWLGGLVTGPVAPAVLLAVTWKARASLTRKHALAATVLWSALVAIYLPVFVFGMFLPAFYGDPPRWWAIAIAVTLIAISWAATAVGLLLVWRSARRATPLNPVSP